MFNNIFEKNSMSINRLAFFKLMKWGGTESLPWTWVLDSSGSIVQEAGGFVGCG